jgi:hypothetical protein
MISVANEVLERLDGAVDPGYPPNVELRAHVLALRDQSVAALARLPKPS